MPHRVLTTHPRDAQLQFTGTITAAPTLKTNAQAMSDENATVTVIPDTGGAAGPIELYWYSLKIGAWVLAGSNANPVANNAYTYLVPPRVLLAAHNANGGTVWFGGVLDTTGNILS